MNADQITSRLTFWRTRIEQDFLSRQTQGARLLPASAAKNRHGDYTHAWVRDNVYSVLAPWALSRAYRRHGSAADAQALEHATADLMRGLLHAMMRQASKIEHYKISENPLDALHAKYDAETGETVVDDDAWGHLQLDATSLFLLQFAQMSNAGLRIVRTAEEAALVQNLVFYIGSSYRTPDYGVWERGNKANTGRCEINASSVGMAKAALESVRDLTITLNDDSIVRLRVTPDEIVRCRETLHALLPAESASKETDAALLSVIGYPAYAIEDEGLAQRTRANAVEKLEGRYGLKRFLRDGHQTVAEDESRLHYERGELEAFNHIECEWPLFWAFLAVDAAMRDDRAHFARYLAKLRQVAIEVNGVALLPELYWVAEDHVAKERINPGSMPRLPNDNVPLYWAQSLWIVAQLLHEGLIAPEDIDPLSRRSRIGAPVGARVDICFVGDAAKEYFADRAFAPLLVSEAEMAKHVALASPFALAKALASLGRCDALGLTGRPPRRLGAIITSFLYEQNNRAIVFTPSSLDASRSYLRYDATAFAARIRADISYVARHWTDPTPPVIVVPLATAELAGKGAHDIERLLEDCADGQVGASRVRMIGIDAMLERPTRRIDDLAFIDLSVTASTIDTAVIPLWESMSDAEALTSLSDATNEALLHLLAQSNDAEALSHALGVALERGLGDEAVLGRGAVRNLAAGLYDAAGRKKAWRIVRRMAMHTGLIDERLADMQKEVVVRLKRIQIADHGAAHGVIDAPMRGADLRALLRSVAGGDVVRSVLGEETLLHLGAAIKSEPGAFSGVRTIRLWEWLTVLEGMDSQSCGALSDRSPSRIARQINDIVNNTPDLRRVLYVGDAPIARGDAEMRWQEWRTRLGVLTRLGDAFFDRFWRLLGRCDGIIIGNLETPDSRIDAPVMRADHTPRERQFAFQVEDRLSRIPAPAYRSLTIEAISAAMTASEGNTRFAFDGDFHVDTLIHAAVGGADESAWTSFLRKPPQETAPIFDHLLQQDLSRFTRRC
jgi:phosphorylase kinase alpha/beta subunit